jgi:protein O-GlcNAc transferase
MVEYSRGNDMAHLPQPDPRFLKALRALEEAVQCQRDGRIGEAERLFTRLLKKNPDYFDGLHFFGLFRYQQGELNEALKLLTRAVKIHPRSADAHSNLGITLDALKRPRDALAAYDRALALNADHVQALGNRGNALSLLNRHEDAIASYDRALALAPSFVEALTNRSTALLALKRPEEALAGYDQALAIKPDHVDALFNRGNAARLLKRYQEALACYHRALALQPSHPHAFNGMAHCALAICDWTTTDALAAELKAHVSAGKAVINPWMFLGYCDEPTLQLECARNYIRYKVPVRPPPLWNGRAYRHDKLRIAYLSGDYRQHATASLIVELLELHDRGRFAVLGVSFGQDDNSELRARLVTAFDQFHDVRSASDRDVAKLLNELEVDIAVDLKGYTQDCRPEILAHRPAPIQVSYLGYPGTMGADFIDYVIADPVVLPFDQQPFWSEKIVHLPDSYQVNDAKRQVAAVAPTRQQAGLPGEGFVFCCFNNNYKITRPVFAAWMRLLAKVEGSVLWLLHDNPGAEPHLRQEAGARGIDPSRLVFAAHASPADHMARHRLADLFLDTVPVNAHTTASDALWARLPVLTCRGNAFAGRVAASLLHAAGLSELVADNLEQYETLALRLATDAALLGGFRQRLEDGVAASRLFDSDRFRRHIEAAYLAMWERRQRGEKPQGFSVAL